MPTTATALPSLNVAKWRTLQRHPLSAEYEDIEGEIFRQLCEDLKAYGNVTRRPVVIKDKMVIDGWQLYRAHIAIDQKPLFASLPKKVDPDKFVQIVNDHRRHESESTAARRVANRIKRVAELRTKGESTRAIAEEVGVSQSQVRSDLDKATEQGCSVAPEGGKVVGKDQKARKAKQPDKPSANGAEVFDLREFNGFLGHAINRLDRLAQQYDLIDGRERSHSLEHQGLVRRLKEISGEVAAWMKALKRNSNNNNGA